MFFWRITKYNPKYRDAEGSYVIKDEWTSYSDIGKHIRGKEFTYNDYLQVENAYISTIKLFMECNRLKSLKVANLEKYIELDKNDRYISEAMQHNFNYVQEGVDLEVDEVDLVAKLILRERLWCKLESSCMFVHFGWDYYMYIGSENSCINDIQRILNLGLFVEEYVSPYMD